MMKIAVEGIKMKAFHGVFEEERKEGTHFVVDTYLWVLDNKATHTDDLSHTVDYQAVYKSVIEIMEQQVQLIEVACQKIGDTILDRFPLVDRLCVRVRKLKPLQMPLCEQTYVEITMQRQPPKI